MLDMINITEILLCKYRDCMSIKQISRKLGHSKNTIKHYLSLYDNYLIAHPSSLEDPFRYRMQIRDFVESVEFKKPERERRVLTPEVIKIIEKYLNDNLQKHELGILKQDMRKQNIHQALINKGYNISYSSVCKYITNTYSDNYIECYIKQHHDLGRMSEFDWGEVKLRIRGVLRKFRLAVFSLPASNTRWGKLYQHENTISFQESHVDYFKYIGGVPHEVVYDNMRVAVAFKEKEKKPTQGLLNIMSHYGFHYRFCNIRRGNEKGSVERSVDFLRNLAFSDRLDFASIEEANNYLMKCYEKANAKEPNKHLFEQEKQALMPIYDDYQSYIISSSIVNKLSTICYDKTHYSVPESLIKKTVELRIYSDIIKVLYNKEEVCKHERSYKPSWVLDLNHYLSTLNKKPGALKHSEVLRQAPSRIKELYQEWFTDNSKEFIELLRYIHDNNLDYNNLYSALDALKLANINKMDVHLIRWKIDSLFLNKIDNQAPEDKSHETQKVEEYTKMNINSLSRLISNIGCYGK